jgi:hypothetical protein
LSTTNPTWTDMGSNPGFSGMRPGTNRLELLVSCGTSWSTHSVEAPNVTCSSPMWDTDAQTTHAQADQLQTQRQRQTTRNQYRLSGGDPYRCNLATGGIYGATQPYDLVRGRKRGK